jgi:hypothetical protein
MHSPKSPPQPDPQSRDSPASILQRADFIRYSRGRIEVVDRAGLESAACECYGVIEREYERLIGSAT